jgi:hypothetical protein
VNSPSEVRRSIFIMRDRSATAVVEDSSAEVGSGFASSREGRKKGAFSGTFGGSMGLFRCW